MIKVKGILGDWERNYPSCHHFHEYMFPESIAIKCAYMRDKNLRGVMIWSIGSDYIDGSQPLLETIGKTIRLKK